jgi:UDP-N-acetylglucosamine:LPS N-acetylglucosamine transferase
MIRRCSSKMLPNKQKRNLESSFVLFASMKLQHILDDVKPDVVVGL